MSPDPYADLAAALDADHRPALRGPVALCAVCHVTADDGLAGEQHRPDADDLPRALAWLAGRARD